jgi:imidazolonepropionase-like amidohydrolase
MLMAELGVSPSEAIVIATRATADLLGLSDRGMIAPGKRADILVVDGDPLAELSVLERPWLVLLGGRTVREPGEAVDPCRPWWARSARGESGSD